MDAWHRNPDGIELPPGYDDVTIQNNYQLQEAYHEGLQRGQYDPLARPFPTQRSENSDFMHPSVPRFAAELATQATIGEGHLALPPTPFQTFAMNNQGAGANFMLTVPTATNSGTQATMGQPGIDVTTTGIYPQPQPARAPNQPQQGKFNPAPGPSNVDSNTTQGGSQPTAGIAALGRFPHISQSFVAAQSQADITVTATPAQQVAKPAAALVISNQYSAKPSNAKG
jgi:hypothetical protein